MDDTTKNCGTETEVGCSAVNLLKKDQVALCNMFADYDKTVDFKRKEELVGAISVALTQYSNLEIEIVYPAMKDKGQDSCTDEPCAGAESHHQVRLIVDQLQRLTADVDAPAYDKAVKELKVAVQKHFDEESKTLFPAIEKCSEKANDVRDKVKQFKAERNSPQLMTS